MLIDYGLSSTYLDDSGCHLYEHKQKLFGGNLIMSSHNVCGGFVPTRRDDIMSVLNFMVFLINGCSLPWSKFVKQEK